MVSSGSDITVDFGLLTWAEDEQFTGELQNILAGKTSRADLSMHTAASSQVPHSLGLHFSGGSVEELRRDVSLVRCLPLFRPKSIYLHTVWHKNASYIKTLLSKTIKRIT
jgi:hypothetical protein